MAVSESKDPAATEPIGMLYEDREFRVLDRQCLEERIASTPPDTESRSVYDLLEDALTDILQLVVEEGMADEDVDVVLSRVLDDRARRRRNLFSG
jgi:hypothetical protein